MSTKTTPIQSLQIRTGVYKTKLNQKLQIGTNVLKNYSDSDTTKRDRCLKKLLIQTLQIWTGVYENISNSDNTNRVKCLQKQIKFRQYKEGQVSTKTSLIQTIEIWTDTANRDRCLQKQL